MLVTYQASHKRVRNTYLHLTIHSIAAANSASRRTAIVAPVGALLAIGTVASHVTSVATNAADDAGGVVLLLRAVVLAMTNLSAVLASLVFVVSKCTVERGKFTKLIALELVLAFRDRCSLNE